ncbi:MAG: transpeptidase family protein [Deltaproteobacteria bacterium]|nr:transpeptidase family protein [Deltaproteobacteria bacterium]
MKVIKSKKWVRIRIYITAFCFLILFCIIFLRAYQLQIRNGDRLSDLARRDYTKKVSFTSQRGSIFDRNGKALAISIEVPSISSCPRQITQKKRTATILSEILRISKKDILEKFERNRSFEWIKRKVAPEEINRVKKLNLPGVYFEKEGRRYYPYRETCAHALGFAGEDNKGLEGIELHYNSYLEGKITRFKSTLDALGRHVDYFGSGLKKKDPYNLILTLDKDISYKAQLALRNAVKKSGSKSGICIVTRPQTGEILAMAVFPEYNPNISNSFKPGKWRNRAVTDCFEPGSALKSFLLAAALEEGVVERETVFNCENGSYSIGRHIIHDSRPYGMLNVGEVVKFSSNIGAIKIGQRLGAEIYYDYLKKFGFGENTGIDLPGERRGSLKPIKTRSYIGINNLYFGQGISVSPIQLIMAFGAIANGGKLMRPYLVKSIVDQNGATIREFYPLIRENVISAETAKEARSILEGVVQKGGTAVRAAIKGYSAAGKTGTAQKVDPLKKSYSDEKFVAIFGGFVPADSPEFAILVALDEPKGQPYGGLVAAPVFSEVGSWALNYLNVNPSQNYNVDLEDEESKREYIAYKLKEIKLGMLRHESPGLMPDLKGLAIREVLREAARLGLKVVVEGTGLAVQQRPEPGSPLDSETLLNVTFKPPC